MDKNTKISKNNTDRSMIEIEHLKKSMNEIIVSLTRDIDHVKSILKSSNNDIEKINNILKKI